MFRLRLSRCLDGLGGVLRADASTGDMWAIPIVATLPLHSLAFGLSMGVTCPPESIGPPWPTDSTYDNAVHTDPRGC